MCQYPLAFVPNLDTTMNLVSGQFIKCVTVDGQSRMLSLSEIFAEAHTIREVTDRSDMSIMQMYRFLITMLQSALRDTEAWPENRSEWWGVWETGSFKGVLPKINGYLQTYANKFDLFSESHPFYQCVDVKP